MNSNTYESEETIRQRVISNVIKDIERASGEGTGIDTLGSEILPALREIQIDAVSEDLKKEFPRMVEELTKSHVAEAAKTFREEMQHRGQAVKPVHLRTIGSISIVSLRMGMIAGALCRDLGIDPVELLLSHARDRVEKDPKATELRLVENAYDKYRAYLEGLKNDHEALAAGGGILPEESGTLGVNRAQE